MNRTALEPMTDIIVAQAIQRSIGDLDLGEPMARECCSVLASKLENLLWKIKTDQEHQEAAEIDAYLAKIMAPGIAERNAVMERKLALRAIAAQGFDEEVA